MLLDFSIFQQATNQSYKRQLLVIVATVIFQNKFELFLIYSYKFENFYLKYLALIILLTFKLNGYKKLLQI